MHLRFRKRAKATARRLIARYTYVILLQLLDANFRYRIDKIFLLTKGYFAIIVQTRKNIRSLSLWIIFERYFTQETFSLADISFIIIASIYEIKKDSD